MINDQPIIQSAENKFSKRFRKRTTLRPTPMTSTVVSLSHTSEIGSANSGDRNYCGEAKIKLFWDSALRVGLKEEPPMCPGTLATPKVQSYRKVFHLSPFPRARDQRVCPSRDAEHAQS